MANIIAITNQKGGVGKTTTCVNLTASLASLEQKVLLVDLDPQGNATMGCGVDKHDLALGSNEVLLGLASVQETIQATEYGFAILPANNNLILAEISLLEMPEREQQLKKALAAVAADYDYILIDCPPSLNMLTLNALVAAGSVLIPIQCEYYALEGLSDLLNTINEMRQHANPALSISGLLRTLFDGRNALANQVSEQLLTNFQERVFQTIIPRNVRLAEAPSHGLPALYYDRSSAGALAYLALAKEFLGVAAESAQVVTRLPDEPVPLKKAAETVFEIKESTK